MKAQDPVNKVITIFSNTDKTSVTSHITNKSSYSELLNLLEDHMISTGLSSQDM